VHCHLNRQRIGRKELKTNGNRWDDNWSGVGRTKLTHVTTQLFHSTNANWQQCCGTPTQSEENRCVQRKRVDGSSVNGTSKQLYRQNSKVVFIRQSPESTQHSALCAGTSTMTQCRLDHSRSMNPRRRPLHCRKKQTDSKRDRQTDIQAVSRLQNTVPTSLYIRRRFTHASHFRINCAITSCPQQAT